MPVVAHCVATVVAAVVAAISPAAGIPGGSGIIAGRPGIAHAGAGRGGYHNRGAEGRVDADNSNLSLSRGCGDAQKTGAGKCAKEPFHIETSCVPFRTSLESRNLLSSLGIMNADARELLRKFCVDATGVKLLSR